MIAPKSMRVWFAFMSAILWTGITLSGFSNVHWLVYLPATGFVFTAITGICPSQIAISKMFGIKIKKPAGN